MSGVVMDNLDYAALYGVLGGASFGFFNWALKGSPDMGDHNSYVKYYMLFGAMGCLAGALTNSLLMAGSTVMPFNAEMAGFAGGFIGSYLLLGVSVYS
jgi:hypothetical protein